MTFKKSRIPVIPMDSKYRDKSVAGEIMVNYDDRCIEVNDPYTGKIIKLQKDNDIYNQEGTNLIDGSSFSNIDNIKESDAELSIDDSTKDLGYNSLICKFNENGYIEFKCNTLILKNKTYTISFYAKCLSNTSCDIKLELDSNTYKNLSISDEYKYYSVTFDTSTLDYSIDNIKIYCSNSTLSIYKLMVETGNVDHEWTETSSRVITLKELIVNDIHILNSLTLGGKTITELSSTGGSGTGALVYTSDGIYANVEDLTTEQPKDANNNVIQVSLGTGQTKCIALKSIEDLMYGCYSILFRVKCSSNTNSEIPILNISTYEFIEDGTEQGDSALLASCDLYESDFDQPNVFQEFGFLSQFTGINGMNKDKKFNIIITMNGNSNIPIIQLDYIYVSMAYTALLPLETKLI